MIRIDRAAHTIMAVKREEGCYWMQIGIDARGAIWYRGSGIGTYTHQLIKNLLQVDILNEYRLVYPPARWVAVERDGFQLGWEKEKNRQFWWAVQQCPPWEEAPDIYHVPHNGIGLPEKLPRNCKIVVTIHDLIPFILPQTCSKPYLQLALKQLPYILDVADCIIAASFHTRNDLIQILGVPEDKIVVIYEAAEPQYVPLDREVARQYVRQQLGLEGPYILNVGGFSWRKNLTGLVEAFSRSLAQLPGAYKLVLVGAGGGGCYEELRQLVCKRDLERRVLFPGFLPVESMPYIYNGAEAFVYPSLYEGFGLPPLEAMACGVPVVAARAASVPEVVGEAALLYEPYDITALAEALLRVITEEEKREQLARRGLQRAAQFSWKKAAVETWMVYQSLA